jgi:hypothetical protein
MKDILLFSLSSLLIHSKVVNTIEYAIHSGKVYKVQSHFDVIFYSSITSSPKCINLIAFNLNKITQNHK